MSVPICPGAEKIPAICKTGRSDPPGKAFSRAAGRFSVPRPDRKPFPARAGRCFAGIAVALWGGMG